MASITPTTDQYEMLCAQIAALKLQKKAIKENTLKDYGQFLCDTLGVKTLMKMQNVAIPSSLNPDHLLPDGIYREMKGIKIIRGFDTEGRHFVAMHLELLDEVKKRYAQATLVIFKTQDDYHRLLEVPHQKVGWVSKGLSQEQLNLVKDLLEQKEVEYTQLFPEQAKRHEYRMRDVKGFIQYDLKYMRLMPNENT